MTQAPFNWKPLAGNALQTLLNRALTLDPETGKALHALDGQRISLTFENTNLALTLVVDNDKIRVEPATEGAHLSLRSSLHTVISQLPTFLSNLSSTSSNTPPMGRMHISGDVELARQLQLLAQRFDPNWQKPFTDLFGDIFGVQLFNTLTFGLQQARTICKDLAHNAAEYITEESCDVLTHAELDAFYDDVDTLRDDVQRLAACVSLLQSYSSNSTS